ncbi:MAG: ATP-binding cassette domain-containing protein [Gammaproteobacteria bacterium]|nr:ATP-binding cassette domain-containing protein [Gammaproteobacteria bacterium]
MITLKNISKSYNTTAGQISALDQVNLTVNKGEIFGIIGKSGAGKSTLIRCVNLLERPDNGQVFVNQVELTALPASKLRMARHNIGMIFQHFNLLQSRTVYDNIALPLECLGFNKQQIRQRIQPLIELTDLTQHQKHHPSQLSGGQKQRVAIARALTAKPHVLLSDEATSALDPESTHAILDLLKNIRDTLNVTILLITHEMSVIKACCDRVGILSTGHLIEENEVGRFFAHPETDIAKNFIMSSLQQSLPHPLVDKICDNASDNTHPVLRLRFLADTATQPVIAHLIRQFQLRVNILQANVEYIRNHASGVMLLAIDGTTEQLNAGIQFLKTSGIQVEVLGHVPDDIVSFI